MNIQNRPALLHLNTKVGHFGLLTAHRLKLLHPPADIGFGDIYVTLGIDGDGVTMSKFTHLVTWSTETLEFLPTGVVEDMDHLVAAIGDVNESLPRIVRKVRPPSRPPRIRRAFLIQF